MKNLKKMLSVFVVIAMLATTMLPAFAAETAAPKTEAEIASGLGVVKGGAEGVTDAYLKASTQRYQAAIIYLRLLGLEETAKVFAGKENFADAKVLNTDMQKYLAYLKANPQHGWLGIGGNKFDPMSVTSAQAFYKVLLESLGYKCTVGDVKGDFDYNNTIAFAAEKGLTKVASVSKFTNADLISAVLEALAVEKKDTGKTLLKTLVDAKVIAEDVAKQYLPEALEVKKEVTTAVYSVAATNGELSVVMTEDVGTKPADADFTVTQAINGAAATTVTGSVYEYTYTTKTVVIKVPAVAETSAEQNVVFSVKYKDTTAVAAPAVVVGAAFGIKEIVEPSLKLIKVNLNKDYDSAKDTFTVYKTSDTAATVAVTATAVTGNAKQVIVKATGKFDADVDYTLKLTRDSKDYTKTFKVAADTTVPQIASVKAIGNKIVRVTFTEPVDNAVALGAAGTANDYNFKIGDDIVKTNAAAATRSLAAGDPIEASADLTSVDFTLNSALATGEYTLAISKDSVNDLADFAGYAVPLTSVKFTVSAGLTVSQVKAVTVNSRSEVAVDFSDAIAAPAASSVYWNTDGEESNTSKAANGTPSKVTDSSYKFSFTTNVIPTGKVYFFVKGVVDAYGNTVPTKKTEVTVAADSIATTTITVENETTVKVKYSKDMQNGTPSNSSATGDAANKSHYTIKKADGTAVTITTASYVAGDKTTTLTLSDKMSGNCTISVSGVKDVVGQEVQAVSAQTITFTDVTAPTVAHIYVTETSDDSGSNKIYVEYSEDMITTGSYSALTVGNYKWAQDADTNNDDAVDGTDAPSYVALPDGTTIAASTENSKAVVITLPTASKAYFDATANKITAIKFGEISGSTIKAVADKAGNILAIATTKEAEAEPTATISGNELKITAANTLRVKVTGKKLSTVAAADFLYTTDNFGIVSTAPSSAKLVDVDGTQYVELTVASDAFNSNTDLTQVKVKTAVAPSTSTATALGVKIAANVTSAAATSTSFTTSIKSVSILDANNVIVILEGNVNAANATALAQSVQLSQGTTALAVTGGTIVNTTTSSNVVKLATSGTIDITGSVTLKTLPTQFITAKDVNNQYVVANTTGVTGSAAFMPKSINVVTAADANVNPNTAITKTDKVVVTFNMVPKLPDTLTITPAAGKLTIAGVGEISGFQGTPAFDVDASDFVVTVSGTSIVITNVKTALTPDGANLVFTPNADLVNNASAKVNADVKTLKVF